MAHAVVYEMEGKEREGKGFGWGEQKGHFAKSLLASLISASASRRKDVPQTLQKVERVCRNRPPASAGNQELKFGRLDRDTTQSPRIILIQMRRQALIPHLLLQLLHRRRLDLNRAVRVPPRHFQKAPGDDVQDVAVGLRVADRAAHACRLHVRRQGGGRLEDLKALETAVVRALVGARGEVQLQVVELVVRFPDRRSISLSLRKNSTPRDTYVHLEKGQ